MAADSVLSPWQLGLGLIPRSLVTAALVQFGELLGQDLQLERATENNGMLVSSEQEVLGILVKIDVKVMPFS